MPSHDTADPWYARGLRFECTGCGRCCTGDGGYVWVGIDEIRALAARLGLGLDDFGRRYLRRVGNRYALVNAGDGSCVFLAGRSCTVYEDRPAQCRAFPWWPANLVSWKHWAWAAQHCEGISQDAPVVPRDVIEAGVVLARDAGLTEPAAADGRPDDENAR